jgi:hypothetical protein
MTIIVCAWCSQHGRPRRSVRAPHWDRWLDVSHEAAGLAAKSGLASHGICPTCWPLVLEAWGLERTPMKAV